MKGSLVIARCYGGIAAVLRVWDYRGNLVYLSEESQFRRLSEGREALPPIGFPIEDVFSYDPNLSYDLSSNSIDWSSLEHLNTLSRPE